MTRADPAPLPTPPMASGDDDTRSWQPGRTWQTTALVVLVLIGLGYLVESWRLPAGTLDNPGIALYPRVGGLLFVGSLVIALAQLLVRDHGTRSTGQFSARPIVMLAVVLGYVVLASTLGHIATSALIVAVVLRAAGRRPWWQIALTAVLAGVGSYLLIVTVLGMPLPAGALGLEF